MRPEVCLNPSSSGSGPRFIMTRLNSEKFRNFSHEHKVVIFEENQKTDNLGEFPDFNEFTLYIIFTIFLKIAILVMAGFLKNVENHI